MTTYIKYFITILTISLLIIGCVSSRSGNVYSRDQARQAQTVKYGTIESIRTIEIEGTRSGVGAVAGGAAGGALGSAVGKGSGRTIATVVGAIAGGIAGHTTEEKLTEKQGIEIMVKLDTGDLVSVVQEADVDFKTGDRVRVLTGSDGTTRVAY